MLRRSSKRAFSSTTQTLCLPFSAASISAGARAESWVVRYTVVLSADHGLVRRSGLDERLDARGERVVRVLHEEIALRDLREQVVVLRAHEPPLRERHPRLVLQIGPVEGVELAEIGEVEQAVDRIDARRG